jgi:hypothetical protein
MTAEPGTHTNLRLRLPIAKRARIWLVVALAITPIPCAAHAQQGSEGAGSIVAGGGSVRDGAASDGASTVRSLFEPFTVPESPAFTFLGTSPTPAATPTTPSRLALALASAFDSLGRLQQGLAFDVSPVRLAPRLFGFDLDKYQRNRLVYALTNTSISLGTARASGDTTATGVALGLRVTVLDDRDFIHDRGFTDAVSARTTTCQAAPGAAIAAIVDSMTHPGDTLQLAKRRDAQLDSVQACVERQVDTLNQAWMKARSKQWNRSSLAFAAAVGWRVPQSVLAHTVPNGWSVWGTYAQPVGSSIALLGQAKYDERPDSTGAQHPGTLTWTARAIAGAAFVHVFGELDWRTVAHGTNEPVGHGLVGSGGVEFRAADQLWIATGVGATYPMRDQPQRVVTLIGLRWRVFSEPQIVY